MTITREEYIAIPLTTLDVMPLHAGGVDFPDGVFGCEAPERPLDGHTMHDWRCPACVLHAALCARDHPEHVGLWRRVAGDEPERIPLEWSVARAMAQREHTEGAD